MNENVRFEPEERPPHLLSAGLGLQATIILIAPIVVTVAIIMRSANQSESYLSWAVFAAVVISGAITMLQSARFGRFGAGYILFMGTSPTFLVVCVLAMEAGGPAMMATLIVASSAFYFLLAAQLSALRRVITPLVSGVVIMLLAAMVAPIVFNMLADVPDSTPDVAAPLIAALTLGAVAPLALRAPKALQLWAPLIGVVVGCVASSFFGLYDYQSVIEAPWIGLPPMEWPGLDLGLGVEFWALLATFALVSLVSALETVGDGVAVQQVSRRHARTTDFRVIQGGAQRRWTGQRIVRTGRHRAQYDLFIQHSIDLAYRSRGPTGRDLCWRLSDSDRVLPEDTRPASGDSGPCGGSLRDDILGVGLRRRTSDSGQGWSGPAEDADCRDGVLDRYRF